MAASIITYATGYASSSTTMTVALGANTLAGDYVVLAINVARTDDSRLHTPTATGMTFVKNTTASGAVGGGAASYISVWEAYNVSAATTPTISVTKSAIATIEAVVYVARGVVSASSPTDKVVAGVAAASTTAASGSSGGLSTYYEVGFAFAASDYGTGQTYSAAPTGFSNLVSRVQSAGDIAGATRIQTSDATAMSPSWTLGSASDNRAIILTVETLVVNPTVTTQAVTAITSTTATLNGNVTADGGGSVDEDGFVWSTTNSSPSLFDHSLTVNNNSTGAYTYSFTGLTPGTLYYINTFAGNAGPDGSYGLAPNYGTPTSFTTSGGGAVNSGFFQFM